MGGDSFVHQDIVKHPVKIQLIAALTRISRRESTAKIMGVDNLTVLEISGSTAEIGYFLPNVIVQSGYADPRFSLVYVIVVIADV